MPETFTCPACGAWLRHVATVGPSSSSYPAVRRARCPRSACGGAFVIEGDGDEARVRPLGAWLAERRRARWRGAMRTIGRAVTGLWCAPGMNVCERGLLLLVYHGHANLSIFLYRRLLVARHHRVDGLFAIDPADFHLAFIAAPLGVCVLVGALVALVRSVGDARAVGRMARGEERCAELRVERADYR